MQNKYISEDAYYNKINKNPVYVVLMNGGTPLSKIISGFTGDTYTHACIAFNAKLKPLYSFGLTSESTFGFAVADTKDRKAFPHIDKYAVYVMYVSNHQLYKMKKRLKWFMGNKDNLKFDFPALVSVFFQKDTENHTDKYFCSRFVSEILKIGEVDLQKKASLYRPESLLELSNISLVNWGRDILHYNWIKTRDNERLIKANKYVNPKNLIPKFESGGNDLYEETHWDTLLTKPKLYFNKKVTMYHYSNTNKDIVVPLTVNAGNKLAKPRFSSWWTPYKSNAGWALSYVIFNTFKESKWKDVLWHVETMTIDGMTYRAPRTIISESFYKSHEDFIKSIDVYEHQKTFNGSDLGRGNEYSVDEYTCDFAVKPDRVRRISWDEMLEIIKIVPDDEFQLYRKELNDMWVHGKTFQDLVHEKKPWLYWEMDVTKDIRARYCKEHNIQFKIDEEYFRFTYHGGGIYEALKQHISPNVWRRLLTSSNFKWLPKPDYYSDTCTSWFTKEGKDQFVKKVLPICEKYLGDEIEYTKAKDLKNIVYKDRYQVVVDPIRNINESVDKSESVLDDNSTKQESCITEAKIPKSVRHNKLFFLSDKNMNNKTLTPRTPNNYFTKNGYEDAKTKRVCFAPSIDKALMGLSANLTNKEFYVHVPIGEYKTYKPTKKEVPDSKITGEIWITNSVKVICIGKIVVIKDKGLKGHKFKYGDKEAELYDWSWKWVEKYKDIYQIIADPIRNINESVDKSELTPNFKKKSGINFEIIDIHNIRAKKYLRSDKSLCKNMDFINKARTGEIAIDKKRDKLAGYIFVSKAGTIQPIHIYEDYRGYGLSETLLKDGIQKYNATNLGVYSDNEVAVNLYKKFGFKQTREKNYKDGEKVIFMELDDKSVKKESVLTESDLELNKSSNPLLNNIIEFNAKTNVMEYIIPNNGNIIPKFESIMDYDFEDGGKPITENIETRLSTSPFEGEITLYHGSHYQEPLKVINPLSRNIGTKLSSPRLSSFWISDKTKAMEFAIFKLVTEYACPAIFNPETREIITLEDISDREVLKRIMFKRAYIYTKTLSKKYVGRGHVAHMNEFTIDVPVTPDITEEISKQFMKSYILGNIKYIGTSDIEEQKNIIAKMLKDGDKRASIKSRWMYHNNGVYNRLNKELNKLKTSVSESYMEEDSKYDYDSHLYGKEYARNLHKVDILKTRLKQGKITQEEFDKEYEKIKPSGRFKIKPTKDGTEKVEYKRPNKNKPEGSAKKLYKGENGSRVDGDLSKSDGEKFDHYNNILQRTENYNDYKTAFKNMARLLGKPNASAIKVNPDSFEGHVNARCYTSKKSANCTADTKLYHTSETKGLTRLNGKFRSKDGICYSSKRVYFHKGKAGSRMGESPSIKKNEYVYEFIGNPSQAYVDPELNGTAVFIETDTSVPVKDVTDQFRNKDSKEIKESCYKLEETITEACKNPREARRFVQDVEKLAKKYNANYFLVTDGASGTNNKDNKAVKYCRDALKEWERKNKFNPDEDWRKNPDDFSDYKLEETMLYEFANKELLDKIHVTSDVELSKWMKSNIKYQEFKKLMTPEEVFESRMGSCHDQVVFELAVLKALKYSPKTLFFIEYNDGETVGGQTHSLVYYRRGTKFYWFENAWGGQAGIHGPYKNVKELKNDIISKHDTKKYKKLQFASFKGKEGMTLAELVKACLK